MKNIMETTGGVLIMTNRQIQTNSIGAVKNNFHFSNKLDSIFIISSVLS